MADLFVTADSATKRLAEPVRDRLALDMANATTPEGGAVAAVVVEKLADSGTVQEAAAAAAVEQVGVAIVEQDLVPGSDSRIRQSFKDTGADVGFGWFDPEGRPSPLTTNAAGDDFSEFAVDSMLRLLTPHFGGGGGGGGASPDARSIRPVSLASAGKAANREYPIASKPRTTPMLSLADQGATSMLSPQLVDMSESGGTGFMLVWSTDHATTHAASGIFGAYMETPLSTPVYAGLLYRDDTGGNQCETPSVAWNPATNLFHVYYQMANVPGTICAQVTLLATSPNLQPGSFTRVGVVVDALPGTTIPGQDVHQGYMNVWRYGGGWFAFNIGGASYGSQQLLQSMDGISWRRTARMPLGGSFIRHLPGYDAEEWRIGWGSTVIDWRGRLWMLSMIGGGAAGLEVAPPKRLCVAPMNSDFTRPATPFIDITPPVQAWEESSPLDSFGKGVSWQGKIYIPYRSNTKTGAFSILEFS